MGSQLSGGNYSGDNYLGAFVRQVTKVLVVIVVRGISWELIVRRAVVQG